MLFSNAPPADAQKSDAFNLQTAVICESISDGTAQGRAVVFSVSLGRVYCYTLFHDIVKESVVYHHWYFRDRLTARIKLALQPPRWSTYSSIQLRENDKGPWRVEVVDESENILKVLRFSIVD